MGVKEVAVFTLSRGTSQGTRCSLKATVVDTTASCTLMCMDFVAKLGGGVDTWTETFYYRYEDAASVTRLAILPAPCHTPTPPLVAYIFFTGLVNS